MPNDNKKRPAKEEPELAAVRAFVEHAYPLWLGLARVSLDKLANGVAEMSVRWIQAGHNVPQVAAALEAQLAIEMQHDKIRDILFAWEEVHKSRYLRETGKFVPIKPKPDSRKSSASEGDKKASIKALESKIEELERGMAKAAKEKALRSNDWLAMPLTQQTVDDYKDSAAGLTRWMLSALDLISKAVEENISDEPPMLVATDIWSLVVKSQKQYERKYARFDKGSKSSKKKRSSRSRSRRRSHSSKGKSRRTKSRSRSRSASSVSVSRLSGSDSEMEYYYRGKFRFCEVDGIEYVVSTSGKRRRTDRPLPGDCDHCGGRHWEWKCQC